MENDTGRDRDVELPEELYSACPSQELSQVELPRSKSLLAVSKCTMHCSVRSTWYNVRNDNSPVKGWGGVPTDIVPYHNAEFQSDLNSVSGSLPVPRFSERFTLGAKGWGAPVFCW